nr:hypothetical protein [Marinicella sp. W31]MDC2876138.1 hypothetical protein [Marinicella sp. W31]
MPDYIIEHDHWNTGLAKLPPASNIKLGPIHGVLPFDGVRNPSGRSAWSHKIHLPYRTRANNWRPTVGIAESAAEAACAHQALVCPELYDLKFQPFTVKYRDEDGRTRNHTFDLLLTFCNGFRRALYVRHEHSLSKPATARQIDAIVAATSRRDADDVCVVNASNFTRQRRENLFRMHHFVFDPDPEADEIVLDVARGLTTLWLMSGLFSHVPLDRDRVFRSCYRLVAKRKLTTDLDNVFWENSRLWVAA